MNTEGIIRTSELVITQLPYRDEFILIDEIKHTAQENMHGKKFKELGYDYGEWDNQGVKTSNEWIVSQLINSKVVKHTRSVLNGKTGENDEYYVLTKIGRKMKGDKGLRTFDELHKWRDKKRTDKEVRKYREIYLLKYQKDLQPLMKRANESTIQTNMISKTTNISIALFTLVAAIYYGFEFCKDFFPEGNPNKHDIEIWVSVVLGGLGLSLVLKTMTKKRE